MKNKIYFICLTIGILQVFTSKAQSYDINTIAGNGLMGFKGDWGPATAAELYYPVSVLIDDSGNAYITDNHSYRVRKINKSGIIYTVAGNGGGTYSGDSVPATLTEISPTSVAIDDSGNIYIADVGNNRIRKVNSKGIISTIAGNGTAGFSGDGGPATASELANPTKVVFDNSGNLYITDEANERIRKISTGGVISTVAGDGIQGYSGDGGSATLAELYYPNGLAVDNSGNLYIADASNNRIREVNSSGIIITIAGNGTYGYSGDGGLATSAELAGPSGVAVDDSGNVFIADNVNARIRKVSKNGNISTVAGNGIKGFSGDGGGASAAELNNPNDVALDPSGNIYIADWSNNRIRKLTLKPNSINELSSNNSIKVSPNPSKGIFNLQLGITNQKNNIEVYNILGEKIFTQNLSNESENQIDLSTQPAGIYLYRVLTEQGALVASGKLVITK